MKGHRRPVETVYDLALAVRGHRERLALTQHELAHAVGDTNRTAIAHLEQGFRLPDGELLARICEFLEMPREWWVGYCVRKEPSSQVSVRCRFVTYYSTGWGNASDEERRRNKLIFAVKNDEVWRKDNQQRDPFLHVAKGLQRHFPELFVCRTFVPVPRSVTSDTDGHWAALRLAQACASIGQATVVREIVERAIAIRKSSNPGEKNRPSVMEHLETLRAAAGNGCPPGVVLVDDVATRGTTLIACAKLLKDLGWPGQVDAVAVAYTKKRDEESPGEWRTWDFVWGGTASYPTRRPCQ